MRLLKEVGALGNPDPTYQLSNEDKIDIINNNMELCERYGLSLKENQVTSNYVLDSEDALHTLSSSIHRFIRKM